MKEKRKLNDLIRVVCDEFSVTQEQLMGKFRTADIVLPRQVYCYVARNNTNASLMDIGGSINRNHATIINAVSAISAELHVNRPLSRRIKDVEAAFKMKISGKYNTLSERNDLIRNHLYEIEGVVSGNKYVDNAENILYLIESITKIKELI